MIKFSILKISFLAFCIVLVFGCANQLPPTGGDDDTTPPRVLKITPSKNTLNYKGNTVEIDFDEYVDRRSLKDAMFISPKPLGELNYNWSGKSVEIEFPKELQKNTTYSFVIGKSLKDIHGNYITAPIQFAFSTGPSIDNGKISGKVYTSKSENLMIFAYINRGGDDSLMNPGKKFPDFFTQVDENNKFYFNHLPKEKFRLFALKDNNKNLLYDIGADEITVLNDDIKIEDTVTNYPANFLFSDYIVPDDYVYSEKYIPSLKCIDTIDYLFTSLKDYEVNVPIDSRFVFYFKKNKLSRFDIAENMKLVDTASKKITRLFYNWASDSVLEVTTIDELKYSSVQKFIFDLKNTPAKYYNERVFTVADERKTGNVTGKILNYDVTVPYAIKIYNQNSKLIYYYRFLENDSAFTFKKIPEGQYLLFGFVDANKNRAYDFGVAYPFKPSEKFFIFEPMLNLKGGWNIENVFIKF